ncbi:heavy-metal-associated domain-containing protein [Pseudomonas sp. 5P_3.1_Bac2]|uniref:heavy-metal-associated domain-containing protein n=1 Tax=Pseudomonas sp. 5P_3.1_Bac2 TaxID=2971617 RepID=UPI0021C6E454|nr:heavy-metal-associated domain-containing protein [Pseudomonas sp. 5P_3.1_Bac2]MCU1719391.1 heavy-metal-associated domain-containing protein [Pseudomonas sp. 5P_3.1_Bac2]
MSGATVHRFHVTGMTCQHCVNTITEAVTALDAQAKVKVQLQGGSVQITSTLSSDVLMVAMVEAGYDVGLA